MEQFIGKVDWTCDNFDDISVLNIGSNIANDIFGRYEGKNIKLTIEVLPDEIEKDDSIKVQVQLRRVVRIDDLCSELGINPYCINEGADGDELINVPVELVKRFGLI